VSKTPDRQVTRTVLANRYPPRQSRHTRPRGEVDQPAMPDRIAPSASSESARNEHVEVTHDRTDQSQSVQVRLAELVAALSLGVDLGFGQPWSTFYVSA